MIISIIAAMSLNRVIGKNNQIPWHIPDEQQRFKRITWGHTIIMGRKTYESIGKPLPGRTNIVITRQQNYSAPGCIVVNSLEAALKSCPPNETEAFIIGGEQIFQLALPLAQRIYLTTILQEFQGDAFFPEFSTSDFKVTTTELIQAPIPYSFAIFERINGVNL
ncbi:MAG: dihydrofolate reductase [candidate division KSB1 bacterium]|nr:dihydrofolate reductase [candidate division KSB1 bacterium]MDZ7342849.1 dihydrofolate reductase [candidate division KSB1 bacterium]